MEKKHLYDLQVHAFQHEGERTWYAITSPQEKGLYIADTDLAKALGIVPSALELLKEARERNPG